MNKLLLKKLLFENILGLVHETDSEIDQDTEFKFELSEDESYIIFKSVVSVQYGKSCWEESESKTREKSIIYINEYRINESLQDLVIQEHDFKAYDIVKDEKIIEYYDHWKREFYMSEDIEDINHDYYYNCDQLRTIRIPLEEIAEYLLTFKYVKPLDEIHHHLTHISFEKFKELEAEINADKLENVLETKNEREQKAKMKI